MSVTARAFQKQLRQKTANVTQMLSTYRMEVERDGITISCNGAQKEYEINTGNLDLDIRLAQMLDELSTNVQAEASKKVVASGLLGGK